MVKSSASSSSSLSLPDPSMEANDPNPGMSSGEDLALPEGVHVLTPPTVSAPQIEILNHDDSAYPSQLAPSDESITPDDIEADPILTHLAGQQQSSSPSKFRARPAPESMYMEGVGPRLSKSAALRMGLQWDDPRDLRRVSGAEMPVNFDNVPGHKRAGLEVNVASLAEPTVAPRQNRAAMLRAGQMAPLPKDERDRAEMAALNRARAAEERVERRKSVPRPASLSTPSSLPRQNRAALLRAGLPAEQQAMRAPSEMAEAAARNRAREQAEYAERRRSIQTPASLAAPAITPRTNRASQLRTGTGETPTPVRTAQSSAVPPPRPPRSHMRALSNVSRTTESSTNSAAGPSKTTSRASSSAATNTSGFGARVPSDRAPGSAGASKSGSRASSSTGLSSKSPSDRTLGHKGLSSPTKATPKPASSTTTTTPKNASPTKTGLTKSPNDRALNARIAVDNNAAEMAEAERLERMARRQTMATLPRGAASGPAALTYAAEKADAERAALQKIAERKEEAARKAAAKAAQDKADWDRLEKRKSLAVSRTTAALTSASKARDRLPPTTEKPESFPATESPVPTVKRLSAVRESRPDLGQAEKRQSAVLGRATGSSAAAEIKAQAEQSAAERAELAAAEKLERLARRQTFSNVRSLSGSGAPKAPALSRISSRSSARSGSLRTEESGARTDFGVKVSSPHKPLPLPPQPEGEAAYGLEHDMELAVEHGDTLATMPTPNRFVAPRPAPAPPPGRPISTLSFAPLPEVKRDERRDEKRSSSIFSKLLNKSSPKSSPRTPNRHSILSPSGSSRNVNRTSMISSPRHPVDSAGL